MHVEVVPALIASHRRQLQHRLKKLVNCGPVIHLDVMDGLFVSNRSMTIPLWSDLPVNKKYEVHFMCQRPELWLTVLGQHRISRVMIPVELGSKLNIILAVFRSRRWPVWLTINPTTPISKLRPWINKVPGITVLAVRPGRYGARWHNSTITRLRLVRLQFPRAGLGCDGGVNINTARILSPLHIQRVSVGSFIMAAEHPRRAWQQLRDVIQ